MILRVENNNVQRSNIFDMEKWYLPITILPGIGLLIISTCNLVVSLNDEMEELLKEAVNFEQLIDKKLEQMRLLTLSLAGFYISTALMVLSGLVSLTQNYTRKFGELLGTCHPPFGSCVNFWFAINSHHLFRKSCQHTARTF